MFVSSCSMNEIDTARAHLTRTPLHPRAISDQAILYDIRTLQHPTGYRRISYVSRPPHPQRPGTTSYRRGQSTDERVEPNRSLDVYPGVCKYRQNGESQRRKDTRHGHAQHALHWGARRIRGSSIPGASDHTNARTVSDIHARALLEQATSTACLHFAALPIEVATPAADEALFPVGLDKARSHSHTEARDRRAYHEDDRQAHLALFAD